MTISTDVAGTFNTRFLVTAEGGATLESDIIPIKVNGCMSKSFSPSLVINLPPATFYVG
jgi:hypothetical protein